MRTFLQLLCLALAVVGLAVIVPHVQPSSVTVAAGYRHGEQWPTVTETTTTTEVTQPVVTEPETSPPTTRARARSAPTQSGTPGNLTGGGWDCIRQRESGGDYSLRDGSHYGAYQFDTQTWASVGGSGNPADASPAEQDARAQTLQSQRGWQPWTTAGACGLG